MTIVSEMSIHDFEPWSGAVSTYNRIAEAGLLDTLEANLDSISESGTMTDTELNDLLWFESDMVFDWLGLPTESSLRKKIEELEEELSDLLSDYESDIEDAESEEEIKQIYNEMYADDIANIKAEIAELEEEVNNL